MSHLIHLNSILVGERQRSAIAPQDQEALMTSIMRIGLLHAPVVEPIQDWLGQKCEACNGTGESDDQSNGRRACPSCAGTGEMHGANGQHILLAGERRMQAIASLAETGVQILYNGELVPLGFLPTTFKSELSPEQRTEVELEENIRRVSLTWQDEARAIAKLHALRTAQNGSQPLSDTANELAAMGRPANIPAVSRAVNIAKHLDNPKVAGARSAKEALNILTKDMEADIRADLIKATGQASEHVLLQGSCLDILPTLEAGQFDVILTDPPYGMGADNFGTAGPAHQYEDDSDTSHAICQQIIIEGLRITKPNALLFMFCDLEHFHSMQNIAERSGWHCFRTPLIWHKTSAMGHDPWPQRGFRRSYEMILFAMKGDRPYQKFMTDVIPVPNISSPHHPAAKPSELFRILLERSCIPGDRVLDPCCGLGPIFPAATALHLQATGIELDPVYAKLADNARFEEPK